MQNRCGAEIRGRDISGIFNEYRKSIQRDYTALELNRESFGITFARVRAP